ncbi:MAG: class I SAM-dependent methyltransferase, partial [Hyphomicrobiaceae bacterium]
ADFYVRHNQRRLEHLASLGLDLSAKTVLEPGAGTGDHTLFYLDRGCRVTSVEPRPENCAVWRQKMAESWCPNTANASLIEGPYEAIDRLEEQFDIVHCYGFLYHVGDPEAAIAMLARRTRGFMVMETCVSMDDGLAVNVIDEPRENPAQAFDGKGCRPTRAWVMAALARHFPFAYATRTQPAHDEFPTDWSRRPWPSKSGLTRAVFVAARGALASRDLLPSLPMLQSN